MQVLMGSIPQRELTFSEQGSPIAGEDGWGIYNGNISGEGEEDAADQDSDDDDDEFLKYGYGLTQLRKLSTEISEQLIDAIKERTRVTKKLPLQMHYIRQQVLNAVTKRVLAYFLAETGGYNASTSRDDDKSPEEFNMAFANLKEFIVNSEKWGQRTKPYHQMRYILAVAVAGGGLSTKAVMRITGVGKVKATVAVIRWMN